MKALKIGERLTITLEAVEQSSCDGCYFDDGNTFKPFDKVLVRDDINEKWIPSIFGCYEDEVDKDFPYVCLNGRYCYCIPYEGNEHLLGTPSKPKDY